MIARKHAIYLTFIPLALSLPSNKHAPGPATGQNKGHFTSYYISTSGNDGNSGTRDMPWKTIDRLRSVGLKPGDTVFLKGGDRFNGTLKLENNDSGSPAHPVVITSFGTGRATINGDSGTALSAHKTRYIVIRNLVLKGAGRKEGNRESGLFVTECNHVRLDSLDISGFQKSGILIYQCSDIRITQVTAHNNGFAGISVEGPSNSKSGTHAIYIGDCSTSDNPGDPTNLTNHSGNGIIVGHCTGITIEYCTATNNGWDMPRKGNGPVGIWAYEADSVLIQHCISYRNRTSPGSADGGGFDLDGGVTRSIIQYCLSYDNEGSAFGIFQYAGASPWKDNSIRHNISINDGLVSNAKAGAFVWNNSHDPAQFSNCSFYNNIVYNDQAAAISYDSESEQEGFLFYNNIFVARDSLVRGWKYAVKGSLFTGNNWWSIKDGFNIDGIKNFGQWVRRYQQEQKNGAIVGTNKDPQLKSIYQLKFIDPHAKIPFH